MVLPEMRLVQSAIVLAEELHFFRAAVRLGIGLHRLHRHEKDHRSGIERNGRRPFAGLRAVHAGNGRSC